MKVIKNAIKYIFLILLSNSLGANNFYLFKEKSNDKLYLIQVASLKDVSSFEKDNFLDLSTLGSIMSEINYQGYIRVFLKPKIGTYKSRKEAEDVLHQVKKNPKYKDAYVVVRGKDPVAFDSPELEVKGGKMVITIPYTDPNDSNDNIKPNANEKNNLNIPNAYDFSIKYKIKLTCLSEEKTPRELKDLFNLSNEETRSLLKKDFIKKKRCYAYYLAFFFLEPIAKERFRELRTIDNSIELIEIKINNNNRTKEERKVKF